MTRRLLLLLALCSDCLPHSGVTGALSQPRVQCQASRYPVAVDCSWMSPLATAATSFIATYRLGVASRGESRPCLQPIPEATYCSIPDIQLFSMVPYVLNVTAVYPTGARSTLVAFMAERIIKPDPPESVCFSPLPGRQLRVQWEPPQSWPFPELFSLKYWIRYRRHGARHFRQVGPLEAAVFVLRSVRPQARHYIQVAAQDLTDLGEPSNWSFPAVTCLALGKSWGLPAAAGGG